MERGKGNLILARRALGIKWPKAHRFLVIVKFSSTLSLQHCNIVKARQALDGGASGVVLPYMETVDQVKLLNITMITLMVMMMTLMVKMVTLTVMMNLSFENTKQAQITLLIMESNFPNLSF